MQTFLSQYATVLLLAAIALTLFALRKAIRAFNQSRRAPYYILREEASRSAGRWAIASFFGVAATVALIVFAARAQPAVSAEPTPTPPATQDAVPTVGPPPTRTPTRWPTSTPAPAATATLTPTLSPDVPEALLTPIPNAVAPSPVARFEFVTLASRFDDNGNPSDPSLQFPAGTTRVYLVFRATGVNDGATWGLFCYRDGSIFDSFVGLWDDGDQPQTARAFCAHDGSPGNFLLRAYLGATPVIEMAYSIAAQ